MNEDLPIRGELLTEERALRREATKKRKDYVEVSVSPEEVGNLEEKGFSVIRRLKTKIKMKRPTSSSERLERRMWLLFFLLGYPVINKSREFDILVQKKGLPSKYRKINIFAKDDETVLVCFCSSEEEVRRKSLRDLIDRISQEKGALATSIKKYYGPDYKPKIIWILATDNIIWSGQDKEFAEKNSINVITEKELRYFLQVADHLRGAARYQFLAEYLKDQHIPEMKGRRVPAIRGKLGGRKFYAFVSRPEDLLKISFVNHRSLNDPQGAPSYQRLVSRSRLRSIGAFIYSGGFFPTNILINFTRKIRFDVRQTDDHTGVAWGDLYMPDQYRSAWIIDGQHRLYGYAPLPRKHQSQNIVVIAFEDLPKEKEAELFVTINHEQKSVPKTLLDDLEGDLKWESDKPGERVGAMAARLVGNLNADVGEPFYGRVTGQGIPVTEKMCLTVPAIKEGIRKSGLVGRVSQKTRQYHPGPLSGGTDQETVERAREIINLFFKYVKESNLQVWNAGKSGLLATNTAVHAYLVLLAELIRFSSLKKSVDPVEMESAEIFEFVQAYLSPIREKLSSMSIPDMEAEFRVVFGSGGPKEYYYRLCSLISKRFPDFNPAGFEQWKEERSEGRIGSADKRLKEINIVVQNTIFSVLKEVYGPEEKGYWEKGVKDKDMMTAAYAKRLDDDGSDLPLEHYLDFIQYKKIASRKENWPHLKDYLGIPLPGEKPSSKDVQWMESINSLRRIPAHATSRRTYKADDFAFIDYVYDQLQLKIPEELWGVEMEMRTDNGLSPFIKWAGGKRWLTASYADVFPEFSGRYYEPFLGGGAVFFHLHPNLATVSDSNEWLISTYKAIRDGWRVVEGYLYLHQQNHCKEYYYRVRAEKVSDRFQRAAQFLYLNRTCWNGLFRVNLSGDFNVPIGSKNSILMNDDFSSISKLLKGVDISCGDFEDYIDRAQQDDFVFVDPPYTVKHNNNGFVKYNEKIFSWCDQVRLRDSLLRAKRRGVIILATNADHESIHDLYSSGFQVEPVIRSSVLAGSSSYRGETTELLIR